MKEKRHYTNQERRRIYAAPKVKLDVRKHIPKEHTTKAYKQRKQIVHDTLVKIKNPVYCKALKHYVSLKRKGIEETIVHASNRYKSTAITTNLKDVISNAVYITELEPHCKNQQSYKKMHLLICPLRGFGYAKLILGEYYKVDERPRFTHYCVTQISARQIKR